MPRTLTGKAVASQWDRPEDWRDSKSVPPAKGCALSTELLVKRFTISATPAWVAAYLRNPVHYVNLNPFVTEVRDVHRLDESATFTAVERIKVLGSIRRNNLLRIEVSSDADKCVAYDVTAKGGISVRIETEIAEVDGGTQIRDSIELTVPVLVRKFAVRQARAAQEFRANALMELASELG
ncbi:SRPBCC family protein [Amycolatopsis sp. NPDC049252]|uniref:SRPBCC family protein n=1 Tax=Amycolatopsis sp. NPDC049252 TaxID=3363933 RepID=UPI00371BF3BB